MTHHTPWMRHDMEAVMIVTVEKPARIIALCDGLGFTDEENQAHADLIIRAVNSHDALVEALERHHEWHQELGTIGLAKDDAGDWIEVDMSLEYSDSSLCDETSAALNLAEEKK